ncbi:hypothetical protein C5Y96_22870 [Blastopirellula marina]|uniref:Uncharacterized protein n=1 Tax=Blastopirellula marina TaxID=124 RepID=A0A2S8F0J8_9BACT|nr:MULTISPECIES: hypothetical protein [Pirellulaceae]PQO25667.1 hypothetical protein C5Y96_22870 [Blastopirellula marina]RCS43350.1 hypothetical protein DTL36_22920 [Bremerella cremea]
MHGFLRLIGSVGIFIGILIIVACLVVAIRVDGAICHLTDQASQAIQAVRERVTDADLQMAKLNQTLAKALENETEELEPQGLEATRKVQQGIQEIHERIEQVDLALEKTLAIVDILASMGMEMDGHRITSVIERTEEIDGRLAKLSDNFNEITNRFRPEGSLREAVADEIKERTVVAVEKALLPAGILVDELNQVADNATSLVDNVRSRLRWTIFWVTTIVVLITAWMALGQLALFRNGLRRADMTNA